MARQRRGGFRTPELRGTLGTLLRTTIQQAGTIRDALASGARDALERGAREGRSRLDDLRAKGRRTDALAELGEIVLDLIRRGEIDIDELPEARDIVDHLDELDAEADDNRQLRSLGRNRHHDHDDDHHAQHGARDFEHDKRYERRDNRPTANDRPPKSVAMPAARKRFDERGGEDGTVASSRSWSPPTAQPARVWRPAVDDTPPPPAPTPPGRRGGISFDDEDLADYMHPDDVPPKGPPKDDEP